MKLTKRQMAILVGTILGDGYLQMTGKTNARLRLEHRLFHKEYLLWKIKVLPKSFQGKYTTLRRVHPATHKEYAYARYQSNASPFLGKLHQVFYPNGKKKIPEDLAKWLKLPLSFAVWYLDDGYRYARDKCAYLYLGCISRKEAEIAQIALLENFELQTRILDKKKKGFALYFSPNEIAKVKELVKPYILPIMNYKLPPDPVSTE